MHQLGKLTKNFVVLDSCNDNKRLSILFYFYSKNVKIDHQSIIKIHLTLEI